MKKFWLFAVAILSMCNLLSKLRAYVYLFVCFFFLLECTYTIIHNRGVSAIISEGRSMKFVEKNV